MHLLFSLMALFGQINHNLAESDPIGDAGEDLGKFIDPGQWTGYSSA